MYFFLALAVAAATTTGSGTAKTEKRAIGAFTQVQQSGSFDVVVSAGEPGAEVTADDNLLPLIVTEVKDGVLVIKCKDKESISPKTQVVVKVSAKELSAYESSGSGDAHIDDVPAAASLALKLSGSGALRWKGPAAAVTAKDSGSGVMTLTGSADKLDASIAGSGKVDASAFSVKDAVVGVSGAGRALVNASATLEAKVSGSGKVVYAGNPKVKKKVSGSGDVVAQDAPAPAAKKSSGW